MTKIMFCRQRIITRILQPYKLTERLHRNVPFSVNWDEKLLPKLTGKKKSNRLPFIISGKGVYQLLNFLFQQDMQFMKL